MTLDTDDLVYFPQEFSATHKGMTKSEVVSNANICAYPGWSVGLIESLPSLPSVGMGKISGSRKQLEIGSSPNEYLRSLKLEAYRNETGKTVEDFITYFLTRLEATNEISHDRLDSNALWLLGNYVKYVNEIKSDFVPTGWWHRHYGRLRMDGHRPGNRICTAGWGASTVVRLPLPHSIYSASVPE